MMPRILMRAITAVCWLCLLDGWIVAQDLHYSLPFQKGIWLNPAESGLGIEKFRVSGAHKSQWAAVSKPFVTYQAGFDSYLGARDADWRLSYGLLVWRDQAGDGHLGTTAAQLHLATSIPLAVKEHRLQAGIALGWNQRSLDFSRLRFDANYDGNQYNPDFGIPEQLGRQSFSFVDLAAGLVWEKRDDELKFWKSGVSVWHINEPGQSFFHEDSIPLDVRYTVYLQHGYQARNDWYLRPEVLVSVQGPFREYLLGSWIGYVLEETAFGMTTMEAGLFTRAGDALVLSLGGQRNAWTLSMAYDVNYSGLRRASQWRGGWELNIMYVIGNSQPPRLRVPACLLM